MEGKTQFAQHPAASLGLVNAKPARTIAENVDELEKRLADIAGRAHGIADRLGGHSLKAVDGQQIGSNGSNAPPAQALQPRVASLLGILASCEESLARVEAAVG